MSSFLEGILCCCGRRRSEDEDANERASLLPPVEDGPSILAYDSTSIDHQKAKERLHVIVKAKEGRMVRVLSRVPFNLRNEPANGLSHASSSRSNRSPSTNVSYADGRVTDQHGGGYDGEQFSPRYRPSPSVSRSVSTTSVQQASNLQTSTDDLSDPYGEHKLKVQLVPTSKNNKRVYSRRGRSKTKHGRLADDIDELVKVPTLEGIQSVDSGREDLGADQQVFKADEQPAATPGSADIDRPQVTPLSNEESAQIKDLSKQLSPVLKDDFEDIGALTRSWGD
ncbi:hypothetical protein A7U60_g5541 [Sanghuangporus baumii]|uniref:Uncharacterized protein n=1 Tax=Sanghuangporus baumii TaxID=108892 RepID=A0A9Q5HWN6_SANBA|nr:hypothetical protein A7U60_g5541 [Sanghuangporus baumii]